MGRSVVQWLFIAAKLAALVGLNALFQCVLQKNERSFARVRVAKFMRPIAERL